jgi:hypothetical protein
MEIHPPTKPIESIKDFLIHLSMITIGILIALGLEQAVEAWHHHELGVQARENILNELRDNKKEIDNVRAGIEKNREQLTNTLHIIRQLLAHQKLERAEMGIKVSGASLSSTSWTTAAATGALGYIGYAEAQKFAHAYELQGLLLRMQEEAFGKSVAPLAILSLAPGGPDGLTDEQLRIVERQVISLIGDITLWDQLATQLSQGYDRSLKGE